MRLIGYVRVSTEEQGDVGYGLAAQRDTMEDWSAARGHELLTVTTDVISTGKVDRMYGRAVAIAAIEMGVADGLLIRALDRGTRDQLDGAQLFKRATDYGWRLLDCDGTDSGDTNQRLVADVRLAMAAEERRKIGQRTREGLVRARREGKYPGRPRAIGPDVERRIAVLHAQGHSAKAIAAQLTTEGIPTASGTPAWHYSTVRRVLERINDKVG
ncbi:resolvase [Nocardia cyriacigeorgica]|uniref:Resolvase n=1 Tax=Nocardia cyriacigeorgica TaxID=135487 RepID=A0A5R8PFI1_9NOCA|nr:recombinase family protein [Nocardia cyriacigeorgica]TLG12169.1 resolvase [Nocardia cyriacigeorgica]